MAQVKIRLDRSRPFSTCHGERTPDDPTYRVAFWQGGMMGNARILLPFDAHDNLISDDGQNGSKDGIDAEGKKTQYKPLYDEPMRKYLAAKIKKHQTQASVPTAEQIKEDGERDEDEDGVSDADAVNLGDWLRGLAEYPAHKVRDTYAKLYHHRTGSLKEIVTDLVLDEKLVPEDEVCADRRVYLPPKVDQAAA